MVLNYKTTLFYYIKYSKSVYYRILYLVTQERHSASIGNCCQKNKKISLKNKNLSDIFLMGIYYHRGYVYVRPDDSRGQVGGYKANCTSKIYPFYCSHLYQRPRRVTQGMCDSCVAIISKGLLHHRFSFRNRVILPIASSTYG